ncbi:helix-turn-helix domain-containing protein [Colwellia sp. MEBiC06753]
MFAINDKSSFFIRAGTYNGISEFLKDSEADFSSLVKEVDLEHINFEDENALLPYPQCLELLEKCYKFSNNALFPYKLAMHQPMINSMNIGSLIWQAPNVKSAIIEATKFFKAQNHVLTWCLISEAEYGLLICSSNVPDSLSTKLMKTYSIFSAFRILRLMLGENWRPISISLPPINEKIAQIFNDKYTTPVYLDQDYFGLKINRSDLDKPLSSAKIYSSQEFKRLVNERINALQSSPNLSMKISHLIGDLFPLFACNLSTIATLFGMSTKSLQRRLIKENITFKELLLSSKMKAAENLLTDSKLSVTDISNRLGYSEQSAFCRAFKRNAGISPREFRVKNS